MPSSEGAKQRRGRREDALEFRTKVYEQGGWTVLRVFGDLDLATAPEFRQELARVEDQAGTRLAVDLRLADFLDSVGVGLILGARRRTALSGGELCVLSEAPQIDRVLELTGLSYIVPVYRSLEEASASPPAGVGGGEE